MFWLASTQHITAIKGSTDSIQLTGHSAVKASVEHTDLSLDFVYRVCTIIMLMHGHSN